MMAISGVATLILLLGSPGSLRSQESADWRLVPVAGWELGSDGIYVGLQVDRTEARTWLPDRLEHELGFVGGEDDRSVLLYLENRWALARMGSVRM